MTDTQHSHAPNREIAEAEKLTISLKRTAKSHPEMLPAQILRRELANVPSGVLAHFPSRENLKQTMRRERRKDLQAEPMNLRLLRSRKLNDYKLHSAMLDFNLIIIPTSNMKSTIHFTSYRKFGRGKRC